MKTSWLKWKPDWDSAADKYMKAGMCLEWIFSVMHAHSLNRNLISPANLKKSPQKIWKTEDHLKNQYKESIRTSEFAKNETRIDLPSLWVSKGNNRTWALNEPYWFWYDVPRSLKLPLETEFSSEYFTEMLLSYIFRLSVVILSNNRCINLSIKTSEFTKMKQESTWKTRLFVAYCLLSVSYYAVLLSE